VQLYGLIVLQAFANAHPDCRGAVAAWILEVNDARWTAAQQVQERYSTAQITSNGRVVFDLLYGKYLLGTKVRFDKGIVLVERAWVDGQPAKVATRASKK
jgi:mRNA-degrading endonuclease HigB of HigAB toxin-antitoxin module